MLGEGKFLAEGGRIEGPKDVAVVVHYFANPW